MKIVPAILSALALCLVGCSNLQVTTDFDPDVDFSNVRSYAWLDQRSGVEGENNPNSLLDRRVRGAVDAELLARGLAIADRQSADVLVSYHIGVEKKLDVNTIHSGYGYGSGWYGSRGRTYAGYSETYVREYEEGTLLIDLIDPARNELIWRGSGQARVQQASTPEEREKRVREVVGKVLAGFPPS